MFVSAFLAAALIQAAPAPARPLNCAPLFASPAGEPFRHEEGDTMCPIAIWFVNADANHDGQLSRTEFRNDALRFFAALDVHHHGVLGPVEIQRYEKVVFPELSPSSDLGSLAPTLDRVSFLQVPPVGIGGTMSNRSNGGGGAETRSVREQGLLTSAAGAGAFGLLAEPEPVAACDLNFDGHITSDEFATRANQRFDDLDTAHQGYLVLKDLEERMPKPRRSRRR